MFKIFNLGNCSASPMEPGRGEQIKLINPSLGTEKVDVHLNRLVPGGPRGKHPPPQQRRQRLYRQARRGDAHVEDKTYTVRENDVVYIPAGVQPFAQQLEQRTSFEIFEIYAPSGQHMDFVLDEMKCVTRNMQLIATGDMAWLTNNRRSVRSVQRDARTLERRGCAQGVRAGLHDARARQRGVSNPHSFKLDVAEDFHNHWHVKSVFLKDVPTTGVRIYNYYDDGVRNTVGRARLHALHRRCRILTAASRLPLSTSIGAMPSAAPRRRRIACKWVGPSPSQGPRARGHRHHGHECAALPAHHVQVRGNPLHLAPAGDAQGVCAKNGRRSSAFRLFRRSSIEEVVRGADIAVGGTTSGDIVSREQWLKPGCTFISLARRELDPAGWAKMDKVVIDSWEFNMLQREFKRMVEVGPVFARGALRRNPRAGLGRKERPRARGRAYSHPHHRSRFAGCGARPFLYRRALEKGVGIWLPTAL